MSEAEAEKRKLIEKPKVEKYRKLCEKVLTANRSEIYNQEYFDLVTELLDWNPELYTVWNYRRKIIINFVFKRKDAVDDMRKHEVLIQELGFVLKKLKRFPKSYWIWNHRIWCLKLDNLSDWKTELDLIETFLGVDARNFHVWAYRRLIIQCMKNDKNIKSLNEDIDLQEFKFTTKLINRDISNYSAWHNRTKLIEFLFLKSPNASHVDQKEKDMKEYLTIFNQRDKASFLEKELELVKTALYTDPEDSSVWFYLKWLISDYFIKDIPDREKVEKIIIKLINDVKELNELEAEDNDVDNKWCLISLVYLTKQLQCFTDTKIDKSEFQDHISKLEQIDPMKKHRYENFHLVDEIIYTD